MEASSQRTRQVRLALMLIVGVAAAAACVVTLLWWKASVASAADTEAKFVVQCGFTGTDKRAAVDPIVAPGPPGTMSHHLHDFFGNTTTASDSTLMSLRAASERADHGTTCSNLGDTAAYWIPTVYWTDSRRTTTLEASRGLFYYRLADKNPTADLPPQPAGLKVVTEQGKTVEWRCVNGRWSKSPPAQCSNGKLVMRLRFPDCLALAKDDKGQPIPGQPLLDTAPNDPRFPNDHRSHMVDAVTPSNGGFAQCPSTHPHAVPQLGANFQFPIPTTRGMPTLSSGAYSTMHADFFNAWDQQTLEDLVDLCINGGPFTASRPKPSDCGV